MNAFRPLLALALCAAASVILVLAGCGSADDGAQTTGGQPMLNTAKIETAIEKSILDQRGEKADVTCPEDVRQKKDLVFSCDAVVDSTTTKFTVTELDDAGHVHYEAL